MKPSILLRFASIITLLYCAGHTVGMPWTPAVGPGEISLIEAMKTHSFEIQGFTRTYWDFYFGFGVIISAFLLVQAVVLWQLGSLARIDFMRLRPLVASFFVVFLVNAVLAWRFFFAVAVVMAVAIAICLGLALFVTVKNKDPQQGAPAHRASSQGGG
jgi:hypothetical protein